MSEAFLAALRNKPLKRVVLTDMRTLWLRIHPEQIQSPDRDVLLLQALREGEEQGVLTLPAARSFERLGNPPMPKFITLMREPTVRELVDWPSVAWVPELGFWPNLGPSELVTAMMINEWLIRRRGRFLNVPLRERSLDIFGDEKYLDSRVRKEALFSGRLPLSAIGAMRVDHPLAYRPAEAPGKPVLVVENHHSFWSLGEWNVQARRYSAVVYGSGNTICSSSTSLAEVIRDRQATGAEYYGDLDPEGINIPLKFNRLNPIQLAPAVELYRALLARGKSRSPVARLPGDLAMANQWLPEQASEIETFWDTDRWIPQEGLGLEQLLPL